jgi:membrane fusion protein, heavy metal efflux system
MQIEKKYLAVLMLAAVMLTGCGAQKSKQQPAAEKDAKTQKITLSPQTIRDIKLEITIAAVRPLQGELVVPAKLTANQNNEAMVGTLVQGRVSEISVNLGDRVRRGQELMHIEGVEIGDIKSRFIKARAQKQLADGALKRQQSLLDQNIGSQKTLLEAKAEYEKAYAEFIAEDKRIHSIGLDDKDVEDINNPGSVESHTGGILPVKAPIDGIIIERNVVLGQLVDQSTTAFRILNPSTLWVEGQVHENDVKFIGKTSMVSVCVSSLPEKKFPAKLLYIGELIDRQTRMVKVRAIVDNAAHILKPEMFADIHVSYAEAAQGIAVSAESIIKDGVERYVFAAVNDTTFEKRPIVPGAVIGETVEIKSGIHAGDRIVSKGAFLLKSELKKSLFGEGE